MKTKVLFIAITILTGLFFSSCEDEVISKPVITELEVGIGNNHIAYVGSDLHIEAEIVAEGRINQITVEIHQEEGSSEEIVMVYDEFKGLKNTTFHKHVDIPAGTITGDYHCHIIVTDQDGNSITVEEEISIQELEDTTAPVINVTSAPTNNQVFSTGEQLNITATLTDNVALEGLVVALVKESDNIADADVSGTNASVIIMLHTHDFDSKAAHTFTASIAIGAANDNNMTPAVIGENNAWRTGNYYILIKNKDAKGNWAYSSRYPVVLN